MPKDNITSKIKEYFEERRGEVRNIAQEHLHSAKKIIKNHDDENQFWWDAVGIPYDMLGSHQYKEFNKTMLKDLQAEGYQCELKAVSSAVEDLLIEYYYARLDYYAEKLERLKEKPDEGRHYDWK